MSNQTELELAAPFLASCWIATLFEVGIFLVVKNWFTGGILVFCLGASIWFTVFVLREDAKERRRRK